MRSQLGSNVLNGEAGKTVLLSERMMFEILINLSRAVW